MKWKQGEDFVKCPECGGIGLWTDPTLIGIDAAKCKGCDGSCFVPKR
jgi:hypothetical protein